MAAKSVITVYGTNPQNPLIPTATNEVGGGDPLDNLFSGLVAYNTDGSVTNEVAESIEPDAAKQGLDRQDQGRPEVHRRFGRHG